ncbi:MAG: ABC-2 type transport system ATP-binding protein [Paraglaciecola psychrophila]|jgi:ABC-2 type transport system ATP-binding protein
MINDTHSSPEALVVAKGLSKSFATNKVLDGIDLTVKKGRIVGLIGPNGAGKTTVLRCLLGLSTYRGDIRVLGMSPLQQRQEILQDVCFIADTAILPQWLKVSQALTYLEGIHPRFNRDKAERLLQKTSIPQHKKVSQLSKGMITQLHLALVMAIDAKLLVLDEPTLGLDILYRKEFYTTLLNDYFDDDKTIIITTHQVEEIEGILTDLLFIKDGKLILDTEMEALEQQFFEIKLRPEQLEQARELAPISEQQVMGGAAFIFEKRPGDTDLEQRLADFGDTKTPSITDLFVAKMQQR